MRIIVIFVTKQNRSSDNTNTNIYIYYMKDAIYAFPMPTNEPVLTYLKGSPERVALEKELERQKSIELDIPLIIGGKEVRTGNTGKVVMPHDHHHVLATYHKAGPKEVRNRLDGSRIHPAQDCRTHLHQVPRRDERRYHARPEQEHLPG